MNEAMLYHLENSNAKCDLCYRRCKIRDGFFGYCKVRKFENGKLQSLVYNKLCSESIDPIEKKPFFHFLPGSLSYSVASVGCNFSCKHCQNSEISQPAKIFGHKVKPEDVVLSACRNKCKSISYTYTEPTIFFENCYNIGKIAREKGLYNNFVTNGYLTPESIEYCKEFLDSAKNTIKEADLLDKESKKRLEAIKLLKDTSQAASTWMVNRT